MNSYPVPQFNYSQHATERVAQRNLSADDVSFIVGYGTEYHKGGALQYYLHERDVPQELRDDPQISRLIGSTLVLSRDGQRLITAYRDYGKGPRHIRRKAAYAHYKRTRRKWN